MKKILIILFAICSALFISCRNELKSDNIIEGNVKLSATINDVKSHLDGVSPKWDLNDAVSVYNYDIVDASDVSTSYTFSVFTATEVNGQSATLTGDLEASKYVAFFPHRQAGNANETTHYLNDCTTLNNLGGSYAFENGAKIIRTFSSNTQNYLNNTFGLAAAPMLAVGESKTNLSFENLAAILRIPLKGSGVTVKSIVVKSNNYPIWGRTCYNIDTYETNMRSSAASNKTLTLSCGANGVVLNSEATTYFHIVLPAQAYEDGIDITINYGKSASVTKKISKTPLERNHIYTLPETTLPRDLSENGTSNCYLVTEAGSYSFNATVAGNGIHNVAGNEILPAYFNGTTSIGVAASYGIVWTDKAGLISDIAGNNGIVSFKVNGENPAGNTVIAAYDKNNVVLWSWHIWVTSGTLVTYDLGNGFTIMDRNVGALAATAESCDSYGLLYQWGRKDPFVSGIAGSSKTPKTIYDKNGNETTHEYLKPVDGNLKNAIQMPNVILNFNYSVNNNWLKADQCKNTLWGTPSYTTPAPTASTSVKTMYDPCPVGYKVAIYNTFSGFTADTQGEIKPNGMYYSVNGNTVWMPFNGVISVGAKAPGAGVPYPLDLVNLEGRCYNSGMDGETQLQQSFLFRYCNDGGFKNQKAPYPRGAAAAVRCIIDTYEYSE